ncbi:MAG: bifunctional 5,10-methylenetetrahydrofolate dehydrogenase/5,10-methenyltetrahydrofolate cyclohydrolase [Acidobacteriota bacterium]
MTATIIDGKAVAARLEGELRGQIAALSARGIRPGLVAVRVGNDPASEVYVRSKARKAEELGLNGTQEHYPDSISQDDLLAIVQRLNSDPDVDGILVQLPLPSRINADLIIESIDPAKDVDGFHPISVGRLHLGRKTLIPCTPAGVIRLIESTGTAIRGSNAVVIGRSQIVGRPVAALLLQRDATVTITHSGTKDLAAICRNADIIVAAVGRPMFVTADMIKPGAVVIDVGINRIDGSSPAAARIDPDSRKGRALEEKGSVIVGDVDFEPAREVASWITPVPGGVGPMTIVMLMKNTVEAATERRR